MKRLLVLFCFLLSLSVFSQTEELDNLSIELSFQKQDTTKVNTSIEIIKLLFDLKDYDKALKYIKQSERLSEDLKYKKGLAEIAYYTALIYSKKEDYINASNHFKKSKQLFSVLKDTLSIAKVNSRLGVIEIERGNYNTGLKYALSAIKTLEVKNLNQELANAYKGLAKAYQTTQVTDKAIEFNLKSLAIEEKLNDVDALIKTNKSLATLYYQDENYNTAIDYYENALGYEAINNSDLRGEILPHLGGAYLKKADYKTAARYLVEGIKLARRKGNNNNILIVLNHLGDLNLQQNRLKTAEEQLLEAGTLGRTTKNETQLLRNYKLMKTLDSTKGNFESAFAWQREFHKLKEKIDASKQPKVTIAPIEEIETPIDEIATTETTENTANNEALVSKQKYDKFKVIFYAMLAAFAVVLTFFVLLYLKRNSSQKYTRNLEAKNKKIELQNEAILEQSKHLENINKVKDKLFSIVSHDLKDSLTSTKGFIDLLKEGQLTQEEFHNLLPELSENANNASLLLFNLLNWSKSQMQSLKPKPSLFNIQEVFAEKIKLVEQKLETKGINLIDNSLRDFIYADRSMIEIVVQNLLANAVKFCGKGDTISISNSISNGKAILNITDTGVGISKENQTKLFGNNTFTTTGTDNEKGTGLGLSICRELVELNIGNIWVESTLGSGSTFYVELPKTKVEDPVNT